MSEATSASWPIRPSGMRASNASFTFCGNGSVIGETMKPGATAFTVIFLEATSMAMRARQPDQSGFWQPTIVRLPGVAGLGDDGGNVDDSAVPLPQHRAQRLLDGMRCAPVRLVRRTAFQSSAFMRRAKPSRVMAALLTRISRRPKRSNPWRKPAFTCSASETSIGTAKASPPAATISAQTPASRLAFRAAATMRAPADASASEVARPIPCDAPVTSATRSLRLNMRFRCAPDGDLRTASAASPRACTSRSSAVCSVFASSTFTQCTERSICRKSPLRTRPDPTSTNVVVPCSTSSRH